MLQFIKTAEISFREKELNESRGSLFKLSIDPYTILTQNKYLCAFGGFSINLMIGGYLAIGNFIPYLASYLTASQFQHNILLCTEHIQDSYASNVAICNWLLTLFTVGYAGFGSVGGLLQLYFPTKFVVFLGGSIITSQYLITYYYTNNFYVIIFCSFGIFYGMGCGIMWTASITSVIRWFPQNKALLTGILMSAIASGSICYSVIETVYINSTNIANNELCGYSLHPEIIEKVPNAFLLLAVFCAVCMFGAVFLFDKPVKSINDNEHYTKKYSLEILDDDYNYDYNNEYKPDYTLKEAIRSTSFWIIFINVLCNVYVLSFVYSDWKELAENYLLIEDDAFLLTLNIMAAICNLFGRIIWGFYYDYFKSYKLSMITVTLLTFIFIITLPVCKGVNKIITFIWICSLWFCLPATYTIFPAALSDIFGDKYCAILTGFIMLSEIVATGLQSGFFTIIQYINMEPSNKWIFICIANALFVGISCMVSSRFKITNSSQKNDIKEMK